MEIKNIVIEECYGYIYKTTNIINGKAYIGMKRLDEKHKDYLGSGKIFQRALKKYGKENFIKEILAFANSKEELANLEYEFIKCHNAYNDENYYNVASGGHGGNTKAGYTEEQLKAFGQKVSSSLKNNEKFKAVVQSEEYREKQRQATLSRDNHMKTEKYRKMFSKMFSGENNPMYGKGHLIAGEKNGMYGKKHTEEWRTEHSKKISETNNPMYGKDRKGENSGRLKPILAIKDNEEQQLFATSRCFADFLGINKSKINHWATGNSKTYKNYGYKEIKRISKEEYFLLKEKVDD